MAQHNTIDMADTVIGGLYVIGRAECPPGLSSTHAFWECLCTCGTREVFNGARLRQLGKTGPKHLLACGRCASVLPPVKANTRVGEDFALARRRHHSRAAG